MGRDGEFVGEFCVDGAADASPLVFDTFASSSLGTLNATAMIIFFCYQKLSFICTIYFDSRQKNNSLRDQE